MATAFGAGTCSFINLQASFLSTFPNRDLQWGSLMSSVPNSQRLQRQHHDHHHQTITRSSCPKVLALKQEAPAIAHNGELSPLEEHSTTSSGNQLQNLPNKALSLIMEIFRALHKPALLALAVGLLLAHAQQASAASGGTMGGRAFSSGRSSRSYSSRTFSAPMSGFSFSAPYAAPAPFFGGYFGPSIYVGPAYGVGVGGGGSFFLLMLGLLAFALVSGFLSDRAESGLLTGSRKTSVLKLQVGLLGMARTLQKDLDRVADRADTSSPQGLHLILTETVLALLRHPDYCISGYSSTDFKRNVEAGEKRFNELSLEERAKFDEETLVNVDSFFRRNAQRPRANNFNNEYIVVTVLVAAEGEHKLPIITSNADLKEALRKLGSIPTDQTLAVEVLWTPQAENDTITERELLRDYALLRPL